MNVIQFGAQNKEDKGIKENLQNFANCPFQSYIFNREETDFAAFHIPVTSFSTENERSPR